MDSKGNLTIDEVIQRDEAGSFIPNSKQHIPYSHANANVWLRFDVRNESAQADWYLTSFSPMVENFAIYQQDTESKRFVPLKSSKGTRQPVAAIDVPSQSTQRFYIRYTMYDPTQTSFFIASEEALQKRDSRELQFCSAILGVFLAMIAYNIFLYTSLRRSIYLWYTLFAAANGYLALLTMNVPIGITHTVSFMEWGHYLRFIAPLTTVLFTQKFLRTKTAFPRIHRALNITILIFATVLLLLFFTDASWLSNFIDPLMLMCIILPVTAGAKAYRQGYQPAKFYLLAMGCFFCGILVLFISSMLSLPANVFTSYSHVAGQAGEMLLMSMALANQIKNSEERRIRAEASANAKSKLLRVLSHDIMNPLAAISFLSNRMLKDPANQPFAERILRSVTSIEKIVRFIVKYESDREEHALQLEAVSLADVFDELAFLFQSATEEKDIRLTFDVQSQDLHIKAEKVCLTNEILSNLVNNAIKFSLPGGKIEVQAREQDDMALITVRDEGTGIPQEILATLFDPHHAIAHKGTDGEAGNGFGMPIVWSFVQELGGTIQISNNPDKPLSQPDARGTLVRLTFEMCAPAAQEVTADAEEPR